MRIKNFPSVESIDGSQDALVIEQTEDSVDKSRKVSPAQIKQYVQTGDFTATGEITDGHGNILKDMAKSADVNTVIGDLSQTGLTGDSVADQLSALNSNLTPTINVNIASYLQPNCSVFEYIRYSKYGKLVIVDIGGLIANIATARPFLKANALPIARTRALGVLSNDQGNENTVVYGELGETIIRISAHSTTIKYYGQIVYITD